MAIVGGPLTTVVRRLAASQRGVSELLVLDDARIALQRAERLVQARCAFTTEARDEQPRMET